MIKKHPRRAALSAAARSARAAPAHRRTSPGRPRVDLANLGARVALCVQAQTRGYEWLEVARDRLLHHHGVHLLPIPTRL